MPWCCSASPAGCSFAAFGRTRAERAEGQRGFVRFAARWAVHSDVRPSVDELLPCQPQTQVIVCAWCLYSAITCLSGSGPACGDGRAGRIVPLDMGDASWMDRPTLVGPRRAFDLAG